MYFLFKYAFSNGLQVAETPSLDTIHFHIKGRKKAEWGCKYSPNQKPYCRFCCFGLGWCFFIEI